MDAKLNPTDGHLIAGVKINDHQFLGRLKAPQLFQIAPDPRDTEDRKKIGASKDLQDLWEIREEVQRLFAGAKAKNVSPYADYIVDVRSGEVDGITPPIILYSEDKLAEGTDDSGKEFIQVPYDKWLVAIDGETQLAARFEAANRAPDTKNEFVAVYICHGRDKLWARQCFHDLNVLGVRPNAALSIGMDARDPLTRVAREVEREVPFFRNRVNKVRRQLGTHDTDVVTITSLRGACITLAEGIGGVKYGARPVPLPSDQVNRALNIAVEWFSAVTDGIGPAMEDRENKLASAPAVLAAIGAMGHELVNVDDSALREAKMAALVRKLRTVDWRRGKHWEGIAGKFTPKGTFSVGGSKETAYAVYEALNDETSPGYASVRTQISAQAAD
jgi:DNA sulfur modification protein DndB